LEVSKFKAGFESCFEDNFSLFEKRWLALASQSYTSESSDLQPNVDCDKAVLDEVSQMMTILGQEWLDGGNDNLADCSSLLQSTYSSVDSDDESLPPLSLCSSDDSDENPSCSPSPSPSKTPFDGKYKVPKHYPSPYKAKWDSGLGIGSKQVNQNPISGKKRHNMSAQSAKMRREASGIQGSNSHNNPTPAPAEEVNRAKDSDANEERSGDEASDQSSLNSRSLYWLLLLLLWVLVSIRSFLFWLVWTVSSHAGALAAALFLAARVPWLARFDVLGGPQRGKFRGGRQGKAAHRKAWKVAPILALPLVAVIWWGGFCYF
jgi:hypothetical protein